MTGTRKTIDPKKRARPTSRFASTRDEVESTRIITAPEIKPTVRPGADCLVCIYGGPVGRRFLLNKSRILIGRGAECDLQIEQDTISRRHAVIEGDHHQRGIFDLQSTNGLFVNGKQVFEHPLASGDLLKVGECIFKYLAGDNIENIYYEEIYRLAIEDGLTQIPNKRYLATFLDREFSRAQRYQRPLSLMIFDLDRFKAVNDHYGHLAGDFVLAELARVIRPRVRKEECFARYGGEEFCVVMPETRIAGAARYAEQIRDLLEGHSFVFDGHRLPVTVSVGVAEVAPGMSRYEDLVQLADERLLQAKGSGRNMVVYT